MNGDGTQEIVGLNRRGSSTLVDELHVYAWSGERPGLVTTHGVERTTEDVAVADLNTSGRAEILALHDGGVAGFEASENLSLFRAFTGALDATSSPRRLATVDIDGSSPRAHLVEGPESVPGPVVPIVALAFPPYVSGGDGDTSSVSVGLTERTSESFSDSVSLSLGAEFGVEAGVSGLLSGSVKTQLSTSVTRTEGFQDRTRVGTRFSISARPDLHGDDYGVVVLSSGCFHAYTYEIDDPSDRVGGHGGKIVGLVPVDGESTVWSTQRYNQLAEALGTLPSIEIDSTIGDPGSYPRAPARLDGSSIDADDMVFPEPPQLLVSDIGDVGWALSSEEYRSREVAMSASVGVSASSNVAGVDVGASIGVGAGTSYGVTVGERVAFGGSVPPVLNDPASEGDQHVQERFSFAPYVYKESYTTEEDEPASFYVVNYTVGD